MKSDEKSRDVELLLLLLPVLEKLDLGEIGDAGDVGDEVELWRQLQDLDMCSTSLSNPSARSKTGCGASLERMWHLEVCSRGGIGGGICCAGGDTRRKGFGESRRGAGTASRHDIFSKDTVREGRFIFHGLQQMYVDSLLRLRPGR